MLLYTAILFGLAGSLHCLGMCAPIAWAIPNYGRNRWRWLANKSLYNSGRVITYAGMGAIVGLLGHALNSAQWQRGLSIGAGVILISGVLIWGNSTRMPKQLSGLVLWVRLRISNLLAKKGGSAHLVLGMLNGLLPCGLVYAALIGALSMGSIEGGIFYMALFGLGTFPMMLGAALFGNLIGARLRQRAVRMVPYMVMVVGLLFVLRGLNLGIPYVSPRTVPGTSVTECVGTVDVAPVVSNRGD